MPQAAHPPSCAKQLRQASSRRGASNQQIARIIHVHCGVSELRAQRLARGLTLKQAAEGLNRLGEGRVDAPRTDGDQLGHWESGRRPRKNTIDLLCVFYDCTAADIGFVRSAMSPTNVAATKDLIPCSPWKARADSDTLAQQVDAARWSVDRTLTAGTVSATQLDLLDEQVLWAREQYVYTPPAPMIEILLRHLAEVDELSAHRQPAAVQVRLSELLAMLATLVADALMKLGQLSRSQSWYATARNAADDSGNAELRARVRAQAAMLPFYYGPLEAAVNLAREARIICRGRPSATAAFAAAAEARALAKMGDAVGANVALRHAAAAFEQSGAGGPADNDAFGFPERRFLLYESGTLTSLGHTSRARRTQDAALRLYPARTGIDPALLSLETAICLARERSATEACQLAGTAILRITPAHRTPIVEQRAHEVIQTLPPGIRDGRAVRELRDILALPAGQV
ncbi:helix-turn-helix transcriptional regulator (plasmid) [Actinacidiphila glaucinigra]|uniref:helix-turn-helix domain-containing protein n=1 Tax=Actinacidiphila glaucinigra TaxID=235986 RepID=UPI002DDC27B8|nr:helix-turn-helix transcriptional regulator [Actinacidiphila glaucinigra]WSD65804.1 helix-turn-helix transcriptional regulator [Actinacidiphila glaucinigra]